MITPDGLALLMVKERYGSPSFATSFADPCRIAALQADTLFKAKMGESFVEFILKMKQSELGRFLATMGDREAQEYLEQVTD